MSHRANTIFGLLARLVGLWVRRWWAVVVLVALMLVVVVWLLMSGPSSVTVGTFNIQDYPKSEEQAVGAMELIDSLGADVVGVQEITRPDIFDANVALYLGEQWQVVHVDQERVYRRVAVLYDSSSLELVDSWTHEETAIYEGGRATLEARFRVMSGRDEYLRVFVVHLKAFGDGAPIRRRQMRAIEPVVKAAVDTGEQVVMVGDFNSTGPADRAHIEGFAEATGLEWSSRELECTAYWDRESTCSGSRLDHILSTERVASIGARGL